MMPDREKYIEVLSKAVKTVKEFNEDAPIKISLECIEDILAMLKEQDELLRKLQNDKDKLCLEVSKWKHKFHDAPPKFVSQGVVDQIRWERDTALSQLEEIGKGLGSKMDDIVAMLKEQDAVEPKYNARTNWYECGNCHYSMTSGMHCRSELIPATKVRYCANCGFPVNWEGR